MIPMFRCSDDSVQELCDAGLWEYDADKDGKLNEAEMAQLNADASKALEARREARKAARGNNDMPPPPAPAQEEGDDE